MSWAHRKHQSLATDTNAKMTTGHPGSYHACLLRQPETANVNDVYEAFRPLNVPEKLVAHAQVGVRPY
jgi:hypothetical protein